MKPIPPNKPFTVLIVENNPADRKSLREEIRRSLPWVSRILSAPALEEALNIVRSEPVDLITLDLSLPDCQGLPVLNRLQTAHPRIPIVVMTETEDELQAMAVLRAGAQDYLLKSCAVGSVINRALRYSIERHRLMLRVRDSEATLRLFIETLPDATFMLDSNGEILIANSATGHLFKRPIEEMIGKPFGFPISENKPQEIEVIRSPKDIRVVEMLTHKMEQNGNCYFVISLHDMTRVVQYREELNQQDRFISHISHELRSPLTVIHQFVSILLDGLAGEVNDEQRDYLGITQKNVTQLQGMISDLLDVTRSKTGKLNITLLPVSPADIIWESVVALQKVAAEKGIRLDADAAQDLDPVLADAGRLRQVLVNLIDNALKFTPQGGNITVQARAYDQDPGFLCISVTDTGCGISDKDQARIFEHLYQVENASEASRKGLGMGLCLSQELIIHHGGRIWVDSKPGKGSTFMFTLPFFSLLDMLAANIDRAKLEKGAMAIIAVEVFPDNHSPLTLSDEKALAKTAEELKRSIIGHLDMMLPRIGAHTLGRTFFPGGLH